jgi:hypothetical protein
VYEMEGEFAFLLENQWVARLPEVQEESAGAAPDELIVHYCDMFPFQSVAGDVATRLSRRAVHGYVRTELVPTLVEAFRAETDDWGFPWSDGWTTRRAGEDGRRLSVALTDGSTYFHGRAPFFGHSGMSINVSSRIIAAYGTLTDALSSVFYHELFHNVQRAINQSSGGDGAVGGKGGAWEFFSEGTAAFASSVGRADVELTPSSPPRQYLVNVNRLIGLGLTYGYEHVSPYGAALYWRFLYEQCGGMRGVVEDPAAGMRVISRTLGVLYSGAVVDIASSTDLARWLPAIIDEALAMPSLCPFHTYEASLAHFARAVYSLRLLEGRCLAPGTPAGCGFFDPHDAYRTPWARQIVYRGGREEHSGELAGSVGIALIEVVRPRATDGRFLAVDFIPMPGSKARFSVQVWPLTGLRQGEGSEPPAAATADPQVLTSAGADGRLLYVMPAIDAGVSDGLAVIVTRVDADEGLDPVGSYKIVLRPVSAGLREGM